MGWMNSSTTKRSFNSTICANVANSPVAVTPRCPTPKVFLCWELGGGTGHFVCLRTIARAIVDLGYQAVLCVPEGCDPSLTKELDWASVIQAPNSPVVESVDAMPFRAASFADVLGRVGFADRTVLQKRTKMWRDLLISHAPDVIVCDFAPTACFAASGIAPTISVGSGFATPPTSGFRFPVVNPAVAAFFDEDLLTQNAWQVACDLGFASSLTSQSLPRWVGADQCFVRCFSSFDPYCHVRSGSVHGPLSNDCIGLKIDRTWPPRFHAYLSGKFSNIDTLVAGLCASNFDGSVYARGLSSHLDDQLQQSHLDVLSAPVDWSEMLHQVSLLIHYAGIGTTQVAAAAGVPQMVIPDHLEQELTGLSILRHGVGAALVPPFTAADVTLGIERLLPAPSYREAARRLAIELAKGGPYRFVQQVVDAIHSIVAGGENNSTRG